MRYEVDADLYEGPLPLLVELAKQRLIDVFLIKLVDLTKQYLTAVKATGVDLNQLAEPLPLLGSLVALKAKSLLPGPAEAADEEEVPISLEELERRLKEYEQFKTVAQLLAELHALQHQHFTRAPGEEPAAEPGTDATASSFDVSISELMGAFAKVLERASAPIYEVRTEPWTVEMKVQELRVLLSVRQQVRLLELLTPDKSKLELVVTFLALLELIRQRTARAFQDRAFGEILVARREAQAA